LPTNYKPTGDRQYRRRAGKKITHALSTDQKLYALLASILKRLYHNPSFQSKALMMKWHRPFLNVTWRYRSLPASERARALRDDISHHAR
jgi:hypothetical protein